MNRKQRKQKLKVARFHAGHSVHLKDIKFTLGCWLVRPCLDDRMYAVKVVGSDGEGWVLVTNDQIKGNGHNGFGECVGKSIPNLPNYYWVKECRIRDKR